MKPHYVNRQGFTIVFTPHARDSWRRRIPHVKYDAVYGQIDKARTMMKLNIVSGFELKEEGEVIAFLYCRRIFNYKRCREEVEVISVTPTDKFLSLGSSQTGHSHDETELIDFSGPERNYCFCCRREASDWNVCDDKLVCKEHGFLLFHKK